MSVRTECDRSVSNPRTLISVSLSRALYAHETYEERKKEGVTMKESRRVRCSGEARIVMLSVQMTHGWRGFLSRYGTYGPPHPWIFRPRIPAQAQVVLVSREGAKRAWYSTLESPCTADPFSNYSVDSFLFSSDYVWTTDRFTCCWLVELEWMDTHEEARVDG